MNWAKVYYAAIRSGDEVVSDKVRAVYERECSWMSDPPKDFPFYFDEDMGNHHIDFIERFCKHSKGDFAGCNLKLELFQKAKLMLVFGWREKATGYRRFREVVDIRGRKCGKSTETAGVEWDVAVNDNEAGGEVYCTANKKDQASLIFKECVNMRTQSPALRAISVKRQSDISIDMFMTIIKALAADTSTMDGLNASFFSLDEFHEQKNSKLYDVMVQSQSMRNQPLAWLISTNGFVREGFFDTKYGYASNVALWEAGFDDYRLLPLIYELNRREDWQNPAAWPQANPGLGRIKKIETLTENVKKAQRDPTFLPTLLTKDFNVPENSAEAWLSQKLTQNPTIADMEYLRNSYAVGGCDLSATTDLTCATLLIRKPGDENFYILQKYFLPRARVDQVDQNRKGEAPYRIWEKDGWLEVNEGATVDYANVTGWFNHMVTEYNIRPLWIGYDRALAGYWVKEMEQYGYDMDKIAQGPITWTYPFKELRGLFEEKRIVFQNNPMLRWCLLNTGVKSLNKDGIESQQPVKVSAARRIDGVVSLLNAYTCYKKNEDVFMKYIK